MSLNTVRAILILNTWSKEARMKAAAARKRAGGKNSSDYGSHLTSVNDRIFDAKKSGNSHRLNRLSKLKSALHEKQDKAFSSKAETSQRVKDYKKDKASGKVDENRKAVKKLKAASERKAKNAPRRHF